MGGESNRGLSTEPREFETRLLDLTAELRLLGDKPEETPESTLRALWMTAAGSPMSAERAMKSRLPELDPAASAKLDSLVSARLSGTPLGHITGRQAFMGLELVVGSEALLPRKETEILARAAQEIEAQLVEKRGRVVVVDTCCGSGNVALALAHSQPEAHVIGVDLSSDAVELARKNCTNLGLNGRAEFRVGDLLAPVADLAGRIDLITCNPPYISSSKVEEMEGEISDFEPRMAFDGGPFGVKILRRLLKEGPPLLGPGGYLAFEVGLGQGDPILSQMKKSANFDVVEPIQDSSGSIRAVVARVVGRGR